MGPREKKKMPKILSSWAGVEVMWKPGKAWELAKDL
jgi:hypothetical protein